MTSPGVHGRRLACLLVVQLALGPAFRPGAGDGAGS